MNRSVLGLGLLAVVAIGSVLATQLDWEGLRRNASPNLERVSLTIFFGGEKSSLLNNPKVAELIERKHRIDLDARKAGSVEMVTTLPTAGVDCLWPSNQVAVQLARNSGKPVRGDENIFNSPIVFFAWEEVAEGLERVGAVSQSADGAYVADVARIAELIEQGARWREDIGLKIYGRMRILSTHPAKSNSGNIWSALLATAFNQGVTPTDADLPSLLPRIERYFDLMGHMEHSSGDIFENFLKQGQGSRPIIVGYENQLVEFLVANAQYADLIKSKIRVLYPEPTIFASHPVISLSPKCGRLVDALQDPEVRDIAWAEHGFRTGLLGVENDPSAIAVTRLPATIDLVTPMPDAGVMQAVIAAVK